MTHVGCALVLLLLLPQGVGKVESRVDKSADFSAFHTYAWTKGHEAYDPGAHAAIVAAIEAQMAGLGFTKVEAGKADVLLVYHALRESDVDLEMFEKLYKAGKDTSLSTKILGKLAVTLSQPASKTPLWSALTRRRLSDDPAKLNEDIRLTVASLFETYPGRKK